MSLATATIADTLNLLTKARASIAKGWTQRHNARDMNGKSTLSTSDRATSWCALGAVIKHSPRPSNTDHAMKLLSYATGENKSIVEWNDATGRTQAQVLKAFDKAINAILLGQTTRHKKAGAK